MKRGAVAEIDLSAISHNLKVIGKLVQGCSIIPVIKADAYGHGSVKVAERLLKDKVQFLSVAFTDEARLIREAGIKLPILVFFDPDPDDVIKYNLIPVISDKKSALRLSEVAQRTKLEIPIHIKVDTGMGRLGFIGDEVKSICEIADLRGIRISGIMSHFSDSDSSEQSFAKLQIERFKFLKEQLIEKGLRIEKFHIANSAAIISLPESYFDAVRPGLMLYGVSPIERPSASMEVVSGYSLLPAMSVKTRIISIRRVPKGTPISYGRTFITQRESLIGVIAIGYADGFFRAFSNNASVLIKGKRVPVVGRVCMDLTMVDLTGIGDDVGENEEVVILGRQGREFISASELAFRAGTIPYEILTSLGRGAYKLYKE